MRMRPWPVVLLILGASSAAFAQDEPTGPVYPEDRQCVVAHILDGDTFNCRRGFRVRMWQIDAPDQGRFGEVARRALLNLAPPGTQVTLRLEERIRDGNGRILAYVFLPDGRMVNQLLIERGFAFYSPRPSYNRYANRLRSAEERAREAGLGVWAR